jgi:hypothetical protein
MVSDVEIGNQYIPFKGSLIEMGDETIETSAESGFSTSTGTCENYKLSFFNGQGDPFDGWFWSTRIGIC